MSEGNTIGEMLAGGAGRNRARPFVRFGNRMVSYELMNERANRVANWFLSAGFRKGDKVAIFLNNCPEWLYVWFGLARIGVVSVPLNAHHKGSLLRRMTNHCDARLMVVGKDLVDRIRSISDDLTSLGTLVVHPNDSGCAVPGLDTIPFPELLKGSPTAPEADVRVQDDLMILYTTDSTGPPQGVVSPHGQYVRTGKQRARQLGMTPDDVFYCLSPLYHIVPLGDILIPSLIADASMVLADRFSVRKFWWDVRKHNVTLTVGFGVLMTRLFAQPPRDDDADHTLRTLLVPGAPTSIHEAFERRFGVPASDAYGMTEVDPTILCPVGERRIGSCGKAPDDLDVRIVDDEDNELGTGEIGEIVCRPRKPHIMMTGYYKMPEQTRERWRNSWFHSDDLGYRDEDGRFYFVRAKNDGMKWRGENVSPYDLEEIINSHPAVAESAAIRVPSEMGGDDVKVAVRLREGAVLAPEGLLAFCEERMAFFMVPRYVQFVAEFPRTETGAVRKDDLRTVTGDTWDREEAGRRVRRD